MSRISFLLAIAAISYLSTSFAQNGLISVAVPNDGETYFQEFEFVAVEFNNDVTNFNTEWDFTETGVEEFQLTDDNGDIVDVVGVNVHHSADLSEILGTVAPTSDVGTNTVASTIGNIVSSIQGQVTIQPTTQTYTNGEQTVAILTQNP